MIAFVDLAAQQERLPEEIDAGIARVLAHGQFILGPEVKELEKTLQHRSASQRPWIPAFRTALLQQSRYDR